jgi:transcriptional regulator with XRE-family HTH domain
MTDNTRIGNQIALLRKQNGFTQDELAEKLEITAQAISKWENGHALPETALLPLLSKLLNSSIDSILMPNSVSEGDTISFGNFMWRVLQVKDNSVLIITKTTIGKAPYHDISGDTTWEQCNLRKYLNNDFYEKFSEKEKSRIIKTKITDRNNPWYDVENGKPTFDNVFLLSYDEVVRYFGDSGILESKNGFYCDKDGNFTRVAKNSMYTKKPYGDAIYDQFNDCRKVMNTKGEDDWWWLRSPGGQGKQTAGSIGYLGEIWLCGDDVYRVDGGVRPALWINI